jgi:small conductance mechanosensitive channel
LPPDPIQTKVPIFGYKFTSSSNKIQNQKPIMNISLDNILPLLQTYALKFVAAIVVLIIGFIAVGFVVRGANKLMTKRKSMDQSLRAFFSSLLSIGLKVLVVLSALSVAGVAVTSFIAVIGAAGLAIGLALQGSLSNFAGGVMILLFKPFKMGDFIQTMGHEGTVKDIQLFHTVLRPLDNRTVIIPNGPLYNGPIVNFTTAGTRKINLTYGIGYGDDADKAIALLTELLQADERVMHEPDAPQVVILALADSSVNIAVRAWVKGSDFWPVTFDLNKKVYQTFPQHQLTIPFPQMDVHVHQN